LRAESQGLKACKRPNVNALQRAWNDARAIVVLGFYDPKSISDGNKMESFCGKSGETVAV
jgi:hypothetical protein